MVKTFQVLSEFTQGIRTEVAINYTQDFNDAYFR